MGVEEVIVVALSRELKKTLVSQKGRKRIMGKNTEVSGQMDLNMTLVSTDVSYILDVLEEKEMAHREVEFQQPLPDGQLPLLLL